MPLSTDNLTEIRQRIQRSGTPCDRTKSTLNAAINALDNYYISVVAPGAANAIEVAAPGQFTLAQKAQIAKQWLLIKAELL